MHHRPTDRKRERGFTLLELGVVVGVVAILFTTVMMMRGYADAARVTAGVEMVNTLKQAARSWSTRFTNRTGYRTQSGTPISLAALAAAGLVDASMVSPWNTVPAIGPRAADPEEIVIVIDTSDPEAAIDLANSLGGPPNATASGRRVTIVTR